MRMPRPTELTRRIAALVVTAGIVVACASVQLDSQPAAERPAAERPTAERPASEKPAAKGPVADGSGSGSLEQIVVTGNAVGGQQSASEQSVRRSRAQPSPSMSNLVMANAAPLVSQFAAPRPGVEEELWIIARPARSDAADDDQAATGPGSGTMVAYLAEEPTVVADGTREIPLPLKHTAVDAVINGYISTVNVRQQFSNPFDAKIEATYLFPLPEKAAVTEFLMIIGERRIRGILREKQEAEAIYQAARSQGYQASLLVQHRPNIFEQKVANIEPGKSIDVDIKYFHTLAYEDGHYSFVFPTVVGPRYNPSGSKDPIVPVPRASGQSETQGAAVEYLRPDERSAHDISINVEIKAGVKLEQVWSTHEIVATQASPDTATVQLTNQATMPNRDFILNFEVAGETIKSNLLTYSDPATGQGYFTLMMYPPATIDALERRPMEMVFVLDCSGSMSGTPLDQAKNAVAAALGHLRPSDTFQIIRFSDNASQFGATPVRATRSNIANARRYIEGLNGTGGTAMIEGVRAALDFPHDDSRLRFVSFMTDGYIGNETDIIGAVHERIGASRVFSFGVGSSVNRYLLERMAKVGRGAVAYLGPQDSGADVMSAFFNRISHAALTDVQIDWGNMQVSDTYPSRLPDMFVGRPVIVTGKFLGTASEIIVSGRAGNNRQRLDIDSFSSSPANAPVAKIWARLRIADLSDRQASEGDPYGELQSSILNTALEHQLMSQYTSFVAVDSSRRTEGEYGTTVHQALPVPDGVRYDTTVTPR